jgi:hypothetical protein
LKRGWLWLAWLACLSALGYSVLDWALRRPGFSFPDEIWVLINTQDYFEDHITPWSLGTGSLCRWLEALASGLNQGSLAPLHAPALLAFALESFLLWRLARRLFGERAACGALLFNALSALTWLRLRSLLSFALLPMELLLLLNLVTWAGPRRSLALAAAGLLGGLLLLDYEAWLLGIFIPFLFLASSGQKQGWKWLALGSFVGMAFSLWVSRENLSSWLQLRSSFSAPFPGRSLVGEFSGNLRDFFLGGPSVPYLGVDGHSAVPTWGWPFLLLGLGRLRARRWIVLWIGLGLLPLAAAAYGSEPNRAMLAWPALCLTAGLGWDWAWEQGNTFANKKWLAWAVALMLGLGVSIEVAAYESSMNKNYASSYGESLGLIQATQYLRENQAEAGPLLSDMELDHGGALRYLAGPANAGTKGQPPLAWLSRGNILAVKKSHGRWILVRPLAGQPGVSLWEPDSVWRLRLETINAQLRDFHGRLVPMTYNYQARRQQLLTWLGDPLVRDPWVRTALWTKLATDASLSGDLDEKILERLLSEKLVSTDPLYSPGIYLAKAKPKLALRMLEAAAKINPGQVPDKAFLSKLRQEAGAANASQ